jgi:hypothetical protein
VNARAVGMCRTCMSAMVYDPATRKWSPLDPDAPSAHAHRPIIQVSKLEPGDRYKRHDGDRRPVQIVSVKPARGREATHLAVLVRNPDGSLYRPELHQSTFVIPIPPPDPAHAGEQHAKAS